MADMTAEQLAVYRAWASGGPKSCATPAQENEVQRGLLRALETAEAKIATLNARLSGMAAVQWQPIETAPKYEGILLWLPEFDSYAAQSWHGRHSADGSFAIKIPFSASADPVTGIRKQVWITAPVSPLFWQPTPAAPEVPGHG